MASKDKVRTFLTSALPTANRSMYDVSRIAKKCCVVRTRTEEHTWTGPSLWSRCSAWFSFGSCTTVGGAIPKAVSCTTWDMFF